MAKKPEEILVELQKQKEDIEILLSSLEEAYSEAGITEKHYKEVKTKNKKKLKGIERKIKRVEKKVSKKAKMEVKPKTVGEIIEEEEGPVPVSKPFEGEMPAEPSAEMPKPAPVEVGKERFSADDIKGMLSRFIKEIKPGGLEVLPKVEKMEVRLEKMNAFLTAIKDEKTSEDETIRRLTEEIGEMRSSIGALDRKASQQEITVTEINTAIGELKPQKFVKFLRKEDMRVKMHDAKIEKIEDMTSLLIKRITQVEEVLKKIGSLEKIADFGRNIAKRLVEIENREKRIGRISDRIDTIFMELNKRLDEFMLYKAKQDTLDELSREMMKAIDAMNTKIEGFAKKEDLNLLRDTLESKISGAGVVAPTASQEVIKLQEQKSEIEGLLGILEEQFKKGEMKGEEYYKAKKINTERLESINKKIQEKSQAPVGVPAPVESVKEEKPSEVPKPVAKKKPLEDKKPTEEKKPAETPPTTQLEEKKPVEKPVEKKIMEKPLEEKKPVEEKKPAKEGRKEQMLEELEESYKKGEISKEAYEKTKKMIEEGK